ncbi:MAG: ABC transporter ATP-binding protein, partial [Oscillospiraceae bacterium]|nr:ABC transporter ATP-binding protein [Oscillospiraceae bacterium]
MEKAPFLEIKDLKKVYKLGKERVTALDGINLTVQKGEIICILGTSGSGKSTLLNMMAGLEKPTKGKILYGGKDVTRFDERRWALFRQKNIGFVFQSYNLIAGLSGIDNVAMPLMFRGMDKERRTRLAKDALKEVGLGNRMKHKPTQMSGGQQQRVGIARAFVTKPKIVFADEPTGNLDSKTTSEVMEI